MEVLETFEVVMRRGKTVEVELTAVVAVLIEEMLELFESIDARVEDIVLCFRGEISSVVQEGCVFAMG